ncbi:MAG: hypothetical protein H7A43_05825 [Verrucomicrobia bacterium]|nr:hypothetical protein [Verrucomicrobiota bacterium]
MKPRSGRLGGRLVLPLVLMAACMAGVAWSDTTPPSLISLSASSPVEAGQYVTLTARISDTGVGVNTNWIYGILLNPQGGGQITVDDWRSLGGDWYEGRGQIGPNAVAGTWKVHSLLVYDRNRNGAFYLYGTHFWVNFQVVSPTPDGAPPVMHSVTVTPNPATLNAPATVTVVVTDDVSGLEPTNMYVNLTHESGIGQSQVNTWTEIAPDTYRGTTILSPTAPAGQWVVYNMLLRDKAGNTAMLLNGTHYSSGFMVNTPSLPNIFEQPFSQQALPGQTVTFRTAAVGAPSPSFQWQRNGVNIPGAIGTSYTHTVSTVVENGDEYRVVAFNAVGAVTSEVAVLRTGNGNYQGILASQVPPVWYRMDGNTTDSGTLGGSPLLFDGGDFGHGGRFDADFETFEKLAYYTDSGQDMVYQTNDIIENVGAISLLLKTPARPLAIDKNRVIFSQGTGSPNAFYLYFTSPSATFRIGNATITLDNAPPAIDTWYYFGASWNISSGTVHWAYGPLGGSLSTGTRSVSDTSNAGNDDRPFILANRDFRQWESWYEDGRPGALDEVAIWHRELTPLDLATQFGALTAPSGAVAIVTHPVSQTIPDGATGRFTVQAIGEGPIHYQWRIDGAPIPGATNTDLSLGVTLADDGAQLTVFVSNAIGTVTSQPATVTVTPVRVYQKAVLSQQPDYWFPLDDTLANFGAQPAADLTSEGNYVKNRLPRGTDNLGNASNAFDLVGGFDHVAQAADMVSDRGAFSLLFRTPALPFDGANRHVFAQGGSPASGNAFSMRFSPASLTLLLGSVTTTLISGQPLQDTWYYFALTWDLDRDPGEAIWYLGPLDGPLDSGVVDVGNTDVFGDDGPVYVGHRNGVEWDNALRVGTESGTVDEIAFWLRELTEDEVKLQFQSHTTFYAGPTVTAPPADLTVASGDPASFTVAADGIGPLTYQWLSNGVVYAGATNATLTIPAVTTGMSNDQYRAVVFDDFGSVTSAAAILSVIPPPPNLEETLTALDPDYWFRFDGNYTNAGALPVADFVAAGTTFGDDAYGMAGSSVRMNTFNASLDQDDLIGARGTLSILFRTPDAPLLFAHLLAQGTDTGSGNALNVVHVDFTGLRLKVGDADALIHPGVLPVSRWYLLVLSWDDTRDAGEVHWWLSPVGGTLSEGVLDLDDTAVIGDGSRWILGNGSAGGFSPWRRDDGANHPGGLDEVALWTDELPEVSISNLFTAAAVGGPSVTAIIGGDIRNGNFNADTSAVDSRNYAVTPFWQNTGLTAPDQTLEATRLNLDFDGTRNLVVTDTDTVIAGMDTGYQISLGDLFDVSYVWRDAFNWNDGADRIVVTLFVTDSDTISGTRTVLATSTSRASTVNSAYESFEHSGFYTAGAGAAGKKLFVEINGWDGNGNPNGFARLDNFELTATTPGGVTGFGAAPLLITRMRLSIEPGEPPAIELCLDTEPGKIYTIDWQDTPQDPGWRSAGAVTAASANVLWYDAGDPASGRPSPLELPPGKVRAYRYMEAP